MRTAAIMIFTVLFGAGPGLADVTATSRIDAVTVFPDGAEVTRVAKVKLDKGEQVILFGDLAAAAVPGSIRVEGRATGKLEIGSVDSRRLFVPRTDAAAADAERKRIEDEIERLRDERTTLDGQVQAAEQQKALIANLTQLPTRPAPQPGAAGAPQEDWRQILALIASGTVDAARAALEAQVKIRETDRKLEELTKKLDEIAPKREERTEVRVFVSADGPLEADLILRYQVPGASGSPFYDARLTTGAKNVASRLQLTRRAAVSQRTGESWDEVLLALSTSRPSAGSAAPELFPVTVDFEPEAKPMAEMTRRSMARPAPAPPTDAMDGMGVDMDERAVGQAASAEPEMAKMEEKPATVTNAPFQAVFAVPGRLSVPSTGEEKRVQLQEDGIDPALVVRTVPKLDAKAYLYAKLTMPKGSPLLSGAVSLFRDGTFVGTGQLPILVSGEEHELGFGVDDLVRVRHAVVEEKRGETGLISSSRTDDRNFRITVKNMHERAVELLVLDQMPASQNEEIKVEVTGRASPTKRDWKERRGVLAWETTLDPEEEHAIEFGYRVTWPAAKRIVYNP